MCSNIYKIKIDEAYFRLSGGELCGESNLLQNSYCSKQLPIATQFQQLYKTGQSKRQEQSRQQEIKKSDNSDSEKKEKF